MGRKKNKRNPDPPKFATGGDWHTGFVPVFRDMLQSKPFKALSGHAVKVYMIIRNQYKGESFGNTVICPYSTFVENGIRKETAARAIDMLEAYGFVDIRRGGLEHRPNEYILSNRWQMIKTDEDLQNAKEQFDYRMAVKKAGKEYKRAFKTNHTG